MRRPRPGGKGHGPLHSATLPPIPSAPDPFRKPKGSALISIRNRHSAFRNFLPPCLKTFPQAIAHGPCTFIIPTTRAALHFPPLPQATATRTAPSLGRHFHPRLTHTAVLARV